MSTTKKTYTLGKIKQLIDLNGDSTNFDLQFKVTCHDDTPFNLLVVDQTTLDNTPELQYKEANKTISGNIVADKNIYQNYFLILKSEKTCTVDVELIKKELPKTPDSDMNLPDESFSTKTPRRIMLGPPSNTPWLKICLIVTVVIVGVVVLWWLYKKNGDLTKKNIALPKEFGYSVGSPDKVNSPVHSSDGFGKESNVESSVEDSRGYRPTVYKSTIPPDVMSQTSKHSDDNGNSLLHRLRKFAR